MLPPHFAVLFLAALYQRGWSWKIWQTSLVFETSIFLLAQDARKKQNNIESANDRWTGVVSKFAFSKLKTVDLIQLNIGQCSKQGICTQSQNQIKHFFTVAAWRLLTITISGRFSADSSWIFSRPVSSLKILHILDLFTRVARCTRTTASPS